MQLGTGGEERTNTHCKRERARPQAQLQKVSRVDVGLYAYHNYATIHKKATRSYMLQIIVVSLYFLCQVLNTLQYANFGLIPRPSSFALHGH